MLHMQTGGVKGKILDENLNNVEHHNRKIKNHIFFFFIFGLPIS